MVFSCLILKSYAPKPVDWSCLLGEMILTALERDQGPVEGITPGDHLSVPCSDLNMNKAEETARGSQHLAGVRDWSAGR